MKKLFTLCVVVLFAFGAKAQLSNWYVGGIVGFNNTSSNDDVNTKSLSWAFGPEFGASIGENWSAGLVLGLSGSNVKDDDGDVSSAFMLMPDIYVRRWWGIAERLNLFVGVDMIFGTGTTTMYNVGQPPEDQETEMSSFGANLNGELAMRSQRTGHCCLNLQVWAILRLPQVMIRTIPFGFSPMVMSPRETSCLSVCTGRLRQQRIKVKLYQVRAGSRLRFLCFKIRVLKSLFCPI